MKPTEPQQTAKTSLGDKLLGKLRGEGPVTFTGEERARLPGDV